MNDFCKNFFAAFANLKPEIRQLDCSPFPFFCFADKKIFVQLVSLLDFRKNAVPEIFFVELASHFSHGSLITIWEDQWMTKEKILTARLSALLGMGKKIHGRKTEIKRIDKLTAQPFFEDNHLLGYTFAYFKLGLFLEDEMVAAALFSKGKNFTHQGQASRSHELIRFANMGNVTVVGSFTKLLNGFYELEKPDDLMTYVERDWSDGKNYVKHGFVIEESHPPQVFWLDIKTMQRHYPKRYLLRYPAIKDHHGAEQLAKAGLLKICNSGNLKLRKRY